MKYQKLSRCLLAAVLGCSLTSAISAEEQMTMSKSQALIEQVTQGQLETIQTFDAVGNLDGFLLKPEHGMPVVMYADHEGQYIMYGNIIGAEGNNISEEDTAKYVTPYTNNLVEQNLEKVTSFSQGSDDAKYQLYALADPNCSACHMFYDSAKPMIDSGDLQIHWILVTFLKEDSPQKAAAIIMAQDSSSAMDENEVNFISAEEEGGIANIEDIPADIQAQLDGNMEFMRASGLNSTPTLIFWNDSGDLQLIKGMPRDFEKFVEDNKPMLKTDS